MDAHVVFSGPFYIFFPLVIFCQESNFLFHAFSGHLYPFQESRQVGILLEDCFLCLSLFILFRKKTTTTRGIYPAKANSRGEITSWLNISTAKVGEFCPKGIDISNHPLWINNWARVHLSVMKQPRKNSDFIFANQQNKLENMASITQRFKLCISISVTIFPLSSQKLPNSISSLAI